MPTYSQRLGNNHIVVAMGAARLALGAPWDKVQVWVSEDLWDAGFGIDDPEQHEYLGDRRWGQSLIYADAGLAPRTIVLHELGTTKYQVVFGTFPR